MATAKAKKAEQTSAAAPPKGMREISGSYAKSWDVEKKPLMYGIVKEKAKTVTLTQGKKQVDRQCIEVEEDETGERYTVWESAGLKNLFSALDEADLPATVWIKFTGYGTAKKGQNPPKLFDAAIGD